MKIGSVEVSKKLTVLVSAVVGYAALAFGGQIEIAEAVRQVGVAVLVYIGAQGAADIGKGLIKKD